MTNGFKFIGISIRTTNANKQSTKDLETLWGKFYEENIYEKIPNKIGSEILSIYTDYKSNFTEDYTTFIGAIVSNLDKVPQGLIGREFPAENFEKYIAKGNMPDAVVKTWIEIWANDNILNRKYTYDFEVYGEKCNNGEDSEVEIYISK